MLELLYLKAKYDENIKIEKFNTKHKNDSNHKEGKKKKVSMTFIIVFILLLLFIYFMVFKLAWGCYSKIPFFPRLIICIICVIFAFWYLLFYLIVHVLLKIKCYKKT